MGDSDARRDSKRLIIWRIIAYGVGEDGSMGPIEINYDFTAVAYKCVSLCTYTPGESLVVNSLERDC